MKIVFVCLCCALFYIENSRRKKNAAHDFINLYLVIKKERNPPAGASRHCLQITVTIHTVHTPPSE